MQRQSKLDAEVQTLAESVRTTQKRLNEERARVSDTNNQLKTAKSQAEAAKEELNNYKDKATRILQVSCSDVPAQYGTSVPYFRAYKTHPYIRRSPCSGH